jgi:hypothetical protein
MQGGWLDKAFLGRRLQGAQTGRFLVRMPSHVPHEN